MFVIDVHFEIKNVCVHLKIKKNKHMKKIFVFLITGLLFFQINAQDIFNPIKSLTDNEKTTIADAQDKLDRAIRMMANADNEYQKYKSYFTSDKKNKQKSAESKTVTAKRNILSAANYYNKGYSLLYQLYMDKLSTLVFGFQDDQTNANKLSDEAETIFAQGQTLLTKNGSYTDKELKKNVGYKSLESTVKNGADKENEAVMKLVEAMQIFENQDQRRQQYNEKDSRAWQNALMENSISGYQTYIEDYVNGVHINEAQTKIRELEDKIKIAELQQTNPDLVYHIQIMADKHAWSNSDIKSKIYFTNETITETYFDGWYKYWIGNYPSYEDAKAKAQKIQAKRRGVFVVATLNGVPVDILQALNVETTTKNN